RRLGERVHPEKLLREGVLQEPERSTGQDRPRGVPAARHDRRRDQERVDRPGPAVAGTSAEELQGRRRRQNKGDPAELHGPPLPCPPPGPVSAGEGARTRTSVNLENGAAGTTRISRNMGPFSTLATRPIGTPRG